MNVIYELYKLGKLAEKRNPMYESSKYAKLMIYIGAAFWAGYLAFFGILFAFAFQGEAVEPYHMLNQGLIFVLALDYVMRFTFQKPPTQEMQPFLLLPIKRVRLIDALLIRSGMSAFNWIWHFMFVPFALLTVLRFYGLWGVLLYCIGLWLLILINNYWYLFTRTLMGEKIWWVLLPLVVYGLLAAALFIPEESPIFDFSMNVGEGFITGNILTFLGVLAVLALIMLANRVLLSHLTYKENAKVEDAKVKHVTDFGFFNRFGEIGEYMRLELKLFTRNKTPKQQLYTAMAIVAMFVLLVSFTDVYGESMSAFIFFYNFAIFGVMFLANVMSYEGNYIDGLLTRKESLYSLLLAKFYLYTVMMLIPMILMIPAMVMGKSSFLHCLSWVIFVSGFVYFLFFQVVVYNKNTLPLNKKLTARLNTNGMQQVISLAVFAIPLMLRFGLEAFFERWIVDLVFIGIGLAFMVTHRLWIRNVYQRFMAKKYAQLEGFRSTRE
ncbi:MAG: hypothetical protein IKN48_02775 [Bacteroidaceae bacterium]|nr:hypothetical protein [Bacteroidaceae bacterium]MBR3014561.1 hypothetical protein [Bacteroidaceae bacterium]MBR3625262.1 hypothetical protein [Bacteroidaceae bacterium]MBR3716726.1 hypothetical protein [Bacteroidaceae bacterium]